MSESENRQNSIVLGSTYCSADEALSVDSPVGSIVRFANRDWCIIDENKGLKLLLACERVASGAIYGELEYAYGDVSTEEVTWEDSFIRKWLNEVFIEKCFTPGEIEGLVMTRVQNQGNTTYGTNGGPDTDDRVFLLSFEEAERYRPVWEGAVMPDGDSVWFAGWLRTPGKHGIAALYADGYEMSADEPGILVDGSEGGDGEVQPAIWVNPGVLNADDSLTYSQDGTRLIRVASDVEIVDIKEGALKIECDLSKCKKLKELRLPASYEGGVFQFASCKNLQCIEVSPENEEFESFDGALYGKGLKHLICCPWGKESVILSKKLESCSSNAFCAKPPRVDLEAGAKCWTDGSSLVTNEGSMVAYFGTEGSYATPEGAVKIDGAFYMNFRQCDLIVSEGVKEISDHAFDTSRVRSIEFPESLEVIGESAFVCCSDLKSLTIPASVVEIGKEAFEGCDNLKRVIAPARFKKQAGKIFGQKLKRRKSLFEWVEC